ncbi:hypothetical protein MN116_003619 [Schistosoma mekongi]|uniref:Kinesin motor domain-containing protein n=1 Tax=Schistosoma mekongi TaxID=38744 RepID=A0AAE2D5M0_SCHME|nr:hypothetical protein MN116_003619 [Schistosoma mekongi]
MNVHIKSNDVELYRPPPGYVLSRSTIFQSKSVDSIIKQMNKSNDTKQTNVNALYESNNFKYLQNLHIKQTMMNVFIHKLLKSIKKIKEINQSTNKSIIINKQKYFKLIKLLQILLLQRQNLQLYNNTLQNKLILLNKKYLITQNHFNCLTLKYISIWKNYNQLNNVLQYKIIQIENLLQNKSILEKQLENFNINNKINEKNKQFENETLKNALKQLKILLRNKLHEYKELILNNEQLQKQIDVINQEKKYKHVKIKKLINENRILKNAIIQYQHKYVNVNWINDENNKIYERYLKRQKEYHKLHQYCISENEKRRLLHNQIQEVCGNIKVLCRCRPSTKLNNPCLFQFQSVDRIILSIDAICQCHTNTELIDKSILNEYTFTFNRVFCPDAEQIDVFEEIRPLITSCIDGYNLCIVAYGPKSSGKTYTIYGSPKNPGVAFRVVGELFKLCQPLQKVWDVQISILMLEIHNEIVYDLLSEHIKPVKLSDDGNNVRLINVEEKIVTNAEEMIYWITTGKKRHKSTPTGLNVELPRSHYITCLRLTLCNTINRIERNSSLILCDLGGSTSPERNITNYKANVETGYTNKSLLTLSRVFKALRYRNHSFKSSSQNDNPVHVPFRDSKLTHLLKPCLNGQAKFILIITICDEPNLTYQSIKALKFGQQAMQISLGQAPPTKSILTTWYRKR